MIGSAVLLERCANTEMPGKKSKVSTHMRTIRVGFMRSYGAFTRFGVQSVSARNQVLRRLAVAGIVSTDAAANACSSTCIRYIATSKKGTELSSRLNQFAKANPKPNSLGISPLRRVL